LIRNFKLQNLQTVLNSISKDSKQKSRKRKRKGKKKEPISWAGVPQQQPSQPARYRFDLTGEVVVYLSPGKQLRGQPEAARCTTSRQRAKINTAALCGL
jgi:hypothetical protein